MEARGDNENENDILNKNQYGFRKGHSTSHAITHLNEKLIENLEKKYVCAVLFIDLKSAFDTIDPDILIKKKWNTMMFVEIHCYC